MITPRKNHWLTWNSIHSRSMSTVRLVSTCHVVECPGFNEFSHCCSVVLLETGCDGHEFLLKRSRIFVTIWHVCLGTSRLAILVSQTLEKHPGESDFYPQSPKEMLEK